MRWGGPALALALLALASACGPRAEPAPDPRAAAEVGEAEKLPHDDLPPPQPARYIGKWAAARSGCADPAWTFRADGLSTAGEISCDFEAVDEIPGGYRIAAACIAHGPRHTSQLQLTFAESADVMLVDGGPFPRSIGLVYCGPLESAP